MFKTIEKTASVIILIKFFNILFFIFFNREYIIGYIPKKTIYKITADFVGVKTIEIIEETT